MTQPSKVYRLHCEICGYTSITRNLDACGLHKFNQVPVITGTPKFDTTVKKIVTPDPRKRTAKLKCPSCGRLITPVPISDVQAIANEQRRQEDIQKKRQEKADEANLMDQALKNFEGKKLETSSESDQMDKILKNFDDKQKIE